MSSLFDLCKAIVKKEMQKIKDILNEKPRHFDINDIAEFYVTTDGNKTKCEKLPAIFLAYIYFPESLDIIFQQSGNKFSDTWFNIPGESLDFLNSKKGKTDAQLAFRRQALKHLVPDIDNHRKKHVTLALELHLARQKIQQLEQQINAKKSTVTTTKQTLFSNPPAKTERQMEAKPRPRKKEVIELSIHP